jgi:hypothetical protein
MTAVGRRIDDTQLAVGRLVTAVDHPAAADLGDGICDTARNRYDNDGGNRENNAAEAPAHSSPSCSLLVCPRHRRSSRALSKITLGHTDSDV